MRYVLIPFFILALVVAFAVPTIVGAAGDGPLTGGIVPCGDAVDPATGDISNPCGFCDIYNLGHNIVQFLLFNVSIPLATIMFLYGGVLFIISGGNEGKRTKAKEVIQYAIIGLLVAFGAVLIIDTIIKVLADPTFFDGYGPWNDVNFCRSRI